jgi:hypothetical protein
MAAIDSNERNPTLFADTTCRKNLSTSSDGSHRRSCAHSCSIWLNQLESTDIRFGRPVVSDGNDDTSPQLSPDPRHWLLTLVRYSNVGALNTAAGAGASGQLRSSSTLSPLGCTTDCPPPQVAGTGRTTSTDLRHSDWPGEHRWWRGRCAHWWSWHWRQRRSVRSCA